MMEYKVYEHECIKHNCSSHSLPFFNQRQSLYLRLLGWDCVSECQYQSQWSILNELKDLKISVIPQFYGKWTFYRLFGIQEPASFIFSFLNLFANIRALRNYNKINDNRDKMSMLYRYQAYFAINAWIWSIVYHARESKTTEYLDYFFAYSIALFSLFEIFIKWLYELGIKLSNRALLNISVPFFAMYCYHFYFLFFVHFDYFYNMKVNITTGKSRLQSPIISLTNHQFFLPPPRCNIYTSLANMVCFQNETTFPRMEMWIDFYLFERFRSSRIV